MRFIMLFAFIMLTLPAARAAGICAIDQGEKWQPYLTEKNVTDKAMHCTLSCEIANRCSRLESWTVGRLKEIWDIFGDGNAEWADLKADDDGLLLAHSKRATNFGVCYKECVKIYGFRPKP